MTFLAAKATHLSALVRELQLDTVSAAVMRSGILRLAPSEQWTWIAEVNLNRAAQWGYRKDLSDAVDDVERQVYGTSATELMLGLWADLRRQSPGDGVSAGVAVVDLGSEGEPAQSRLRHLVLTRDRWRSRAVPSFFFADGRGAGKTDQALVVGAGEVDWLAFAPLLHGRSRHGQVAFTTSALLERALAQAVSSLSVRLHLATLTAKTSASSIAGEVNRRAREVHSRFEAEAAAECVSAGMRALDGVEALEGKRLEAGEIDVLAGGVGVERPVLLVGECKNLDFSFFKDSGPGQTRDVLRHATDQVLRKRAWVAANWGTVSRALRLPQIEPEVVGVVVTRTLAVPALDAGIPIVSIGELAELARTVIGTTAGAWPGALLARPRSGHV